MSIQLISDIDIAEKIGISKKCGYWEVNGLYFFDKFQALRYATAQNINNIRYRFYDSAYNSLNWLKEPIESLDSMYRDRAQQLRDTYDYLILSFSGGADSTNILKTFIDNGIRLDEVYCEYPIPVLSSLKEALKGTHKSSDLVAFEWFAAAEPMLKSLAKSNPEIKITVHSIVDESIQMVENCELYKHKRGGSINPLIRFDKLYNVAKERTKFGTVACINGLDKPRVAYDPRSDMFINAFSDFSNAFSEFSTYAFSEYQISIEQFYNTYNYPQLNQKMAYAIKNSIKSLIFNSSEYTSLLSHIRQDGIHVFDVHKNFFKKALYNKWDTNIWQADKSANIFYSPLTKWFFDKSITTDRTRDFYDKQLQELLFGIDKKFIMFEHNKPISLIHYTTQGNLF